MLLVYSFIWRRELEPQIWRNGFNEENRSASLAFEESHLHLVNYLTQTWRNGRKNNCLQCFSTWFKYEWMNLWFGRCASNCGLMPILISPSKEKKKRQNFSELCSTQHLISMDSAVCMWNLKWLSPLFVVVWSARASCRGSRPGLNQRDAAVNEDTAVSLLNSANRSVLVCGQRLQHLLDPALHRPACSEWPSAW